MINLVILVIVSVLFGCSGVESAYELYNSNSIEPRAWIKKRSNVDEAKASIYKRVDILKDSNAREIKSVSDWNKHRPRVMAFFADNVYGRPLARPQTLEFKLLERGYASDINALRKQYKITASNNGKSFSFNVVVYIPKNAKGKIPAFVSPNFSGNHAIWADKDIILPNHFLGNNERVGINDNKAHDYQRGKNAWRHPIDEIIARGYAFATFCYCEVFPDKPTGASDSVYQIYSPRKKSTAIPAWAWGNSRVFDLLESIPEIDITSVAVVGHSRLGKTAIYSGVFDPRFAVVYSNDSGCLGAATNSRNFGETIGFMSKSASLNYWFLDKINDYSGSNVEKMPFDQFHLLACIAPRAIYVASATNDLWADPKGEYISLKEAGKVYKLFGADDLPTDENLYIERPFVGDVGHHLRRGNHDMTKYDWQCFMDFCDKYFGSK